MFSIVIDILLGIHILVSLLIILIVLMQRPKSEGIGAAFGGEMMSEMFANTSNALANVTRWLGGIFFFLTLVLSILYAKQSTQHSAIQAAAIKAAAAAGPIPSATPEASPAATTGTAAQPPTGSSAAASSPGALLKPAASTSPVSGGAAAHSGSAAH